ATPQRVVVEISRNGLDYLRPKHPSSHPWARVAFWLAVLAMALASLALVAKFVLWFCRRAFGLLPGSRLRALYRRTILGCPNWVPLLGIGVLSATVACGCIDGESERGEPLSFTSGASYWPAVFCRILAGIIATFFVFRMADAPRSLAKLTNEGVLRM